MKRVIKFTIFGIVELAGAFLAWWGLSCYGYWIDSMAFVPNTLKHGTMLEKWIEAPLMCGMFLGIFLPVIGIAIAVIGIAIVVIVALGLIQAVKWNWKWAGK